MSSKMARLIEYEPVEKVTWAEMRTNFKEAQGIKAKFGERVKRVRGTRRHSNNEEE